MKTIIVVLSSLTPDGGLGQRMESLLLRYVHSPLIEESYFLCQFDLHMEQVPSDKSYLLSLLTARKSTFLLTLQGLTLF